MIERSRVRISAVTAGDFSSSGSTFCANTSVLPQKHVKDPGESHSAKSAGGRLQLNTHAPYVCGFAWSDMVHGCMVYTERAETVAVSCGTSHASAVSTPLRWIFKNALWKASHSCRITCERSESAWERRIFLKSANFGVNPSFKATKQRLKRR